MLVVVVRTKLREADADRHVAPGRVLQREAVDRRTDALHRGVPAHDVLLRQEHDELLAAEPIDAVARAELALDRPNDRLERFVAREVAVGVVVVLEMVEVAHRDGARTPVAARLLAKREQVLGERAAVLRAGERRRRARRRTGARCRAGAAGFAPGAPGGR